MGKIQQFSKPKISTTKRQTVRELKEELEKKLEKLSQQIRYVELQGKTLFRSQNQLVEHVKTNRFKLQQNEIDINKNFYNWKDLREDFESKFDWKLPSEDFDLVEVEDFDKFEEELLNNFE